MRLTTVVLALAILTPAARAEPPRPPCAGDAHPAPTGVDEPPRIVVWQPGEPGADWAVPACLGWFVDGSAVTVATAGRLRAAGGVESLLDRLRQLSSFGEIQYWSIRRAAWRPVYRDVEPVTDASGRERRGDFGRDEIVSGATLYLREHIDSLLGPMVQRLRVLHRDADRLEVDVENVSPGRVALLTVIPEGGARTRLTLEREGEDVWRYYTLTRVVDLVPDLLAPPRGSWVNRATAMFRWFAGIPTDQEPPTVR